MNHGYFRPPTFPFSPILFDPVHSYLLSHRSLQPIDWSTIEKSPSMQHFIHNYWPVMVERRSSTISNSISRIYIRPESRVCLNIQLSFICCFKECIISFQIIRHVLFYYIHIQEKWFWFSYMFETLSFFPWPLHFHPVLHRHISCYPKINAKAALPRRKPQRYSFHWKCIIFSTLGPKLRFLLWVIVLLYYKFSINTIHPLTATRLCLDFRWSRYIDCLILR